MIVIVFLFLFFTGKFNDMGSHYVHTLHIKHESMSAEKYLQHLLLLNGKTSMSSLFYFFFNVYIHILHF